ncbi:hypothetical protein [Mucilaginibacter sp.]|uniref:hypothetical protein n=1 Tax=Mucilaginibacter sp. TaxID=1882438 RepID=UPI003264C6D9
MKKVTYLFFAIAFSLMILSIVPAKAQCAMCTAAVESNSKSGNHATKGLNAGIMYLLAAPYLAVTVCGYIWYKKYRRKNVVLDMHNEKLNLN